MKSMVSLVLILAIAGAAAAVIKLTVAVAGAILGMILLVGILSLVSK
jgi:hypothetical protein